MAIETATPIQIICETPQVRAKRTTSTISWYGQMTSEEPVWGDVSVGLHEQTFNQLFAALDERGMIRNGMAALFFGSHEGYDVRLFKRFVDSKGYKNVEILALEMADRYSKKVRGWDSFCKVPGVDYIRGDAVYSPLAAGSVDLIVDRLAATYTSFGYSPESGLQVLAEANRILRPGGSLILDGGNLIKIQRINIWGSSAARIEKLHPELFKQMEDGFVHLVDPTDPQDYRFEVRKFNVPGIPSEWGQFELWDGRERTNQWLHYQFTKV